MLAQARIHSETPNVIDPGDMPPSRPSRLQKQQDQSSYSDAESGNIPVRGRPSYTDKEDPRDRFKPSLSRTIKLDYALPADDEPNPQGDIEVAAHEVDLNPAVDDTESGLPSGKSQRPGVAQAQRAGSTENARLFAATMLAETERRESSRSLMGAKSPRKSGKTKWPRRGRRSEFRGLRTSAPMDDQHENLYAREGLLKPRNRRCDRYCRRFVFLLLCVNVILAFSVVAYRTFSRGDKYPSQTMASSARLEATMDFLAESGISEREALESTSSPQYQAASWLATQDREYVDVPESLENNPFHFVQRYVLATLYYSLEGSNWKKSLNFVTDEHECSWFESIPDNSGERFAVGVTCDDELQVRNLLITSNKLKGQIPSELSHLSKLDFLSFSHNKLSGTIPSSIANLSLLDYLDLKYNHFTGAVPDFLGNLNRLEVLGLSKNQLTGNLPGSLGGLVNLKTLSIDDNVLDGDISVIAMMTNLEYLYAEKNNFSGRLDDGLLTDLHALREVDLSENQLESDSIPHRLFTHPEMRILDLHGNKLGGSIPDGIPEESVMEYLSLRDNSLDGSIPDHIDHMRALTHLDLEGNSFTGVLPETLSKMTTLEYLFLGKNPISNSTIPDGISSLSALKELSLDGLGLSGPVPSWIEDLQELKLLDLRTNALSGDVAIDFSNMPNLAYLLLNDNLLSGTVPKGLGTQANLQVVALHNNDIEGEADSLCSSQSEVQFLSTDCSIILCPCCDQCCETPDCYEEVLFDALENVENDWESGFKRSSYAFNPSILYEETSEGTD